MEVHDKCFNECKRMSSTLYGLSSLQPLAICSTQIGLAVGDTQKEREKAEFTKLKVWVITFCTDT